MALGNATVGFAFWGLKVPDWLGSLDYKYAEQMLRMKRNAQPLPEICKARL